MKRLLVAVVLVAIALSLSFAQGTPAVTYVHHDKVATLTTTPGPLANGPDFAASIARRTGPGQVEIHDKETDLFYILEGEATFVTGGTMVGGRVSRPNQQLGTDIQGGQSHQLSKGDFISVPPGTPHWFKEVTKPITYHLIKVVRP